MFHCHPPWYLIIHLGTHEGSNCAEGCDDAPIVCAKLDIIFPCLGAGRPPLLKGAFPAPKAHVPLLFASKAWPCQQTSLTRSQFFVLWETIPNFPLGGIRFDALRLCCTCCCPWKPFGSPRNDCGPTATLGCQQITLVSFCLLAMNTKPQDQSKQIC